jgi:hypothetical protein
MKIAIKLLIWIVIACGLCVSGSALYGGQSGTPGHEQTPSVATPSPQVAAVFPRNPGETPPSDEKILAGEKAAVGMLGLTDSYSRLFSRAGAIFVAFSGKFGDSVSITMYYEANSGNPIGMSWPSGKSNVAQMTKSQVIAKCGKPNQVTSDYIAYGYVLLSFGEDGHLSKITIQFKQ